MQSEKWMGMEPMGGGAMGGGIGLLLLALAVLVAILWIFLPFAVFGTKDILRQILATQRAILEELRRRRE
jgi:hypothetical protein